jgi:hypothetical protein
MPERQDSKAKHAQQATHSAMHMFDGGGAGAGAGSAGAAIANPSGTSAAWLPLRERIDGSALSEGSGGGVWQQGAAQPIRRLRLTRRWLRGGGQAGQGCGGWRGGRQRGGSDGGARRVGGAGERGWGVGRGTVDGAG